MRHETAIAVIEALGDTLIAKDAFTDTLKEHITFLSDSNERLRKEMGELIGRDDEKIKAECEEIAKGAGCDCESGCKVHSSAQTTEGEEQCFKADENEETQGNPYLYGTYFVLPDEGLTLQAVCAFLKQTIKEISELFGGVRVNNFEIIVRHDTIGWKITSGREILGAENLRLSKERMVDFVAEELKIEE